MPSLCNNNNSPTTFIRREYHVTSYNERGAAIVFALGAVAASAKAGQYAVQGYNEWKIEQQKREEEEIQNSGAKEEEGGESSSADSKASDDASSPGGNSDKSTQSGSTKEGKRENIFANFFNMSVGSKYYEGGFEDKMTRKEAALILGVRESSTAKRIKDAHRKLLILNHPDTGGSTYLAGKLNEAKELLLKGKK
ncbi:hypothetical protein ACHAXR_002499 [Thalassiosira sp. AJA248-18]